MRPMVRHPFVSVAVSILIVAVWVVTSAVWAWNGLRGLADGLLFGDWSYWGLVSEEMRKRRAP